jgi:nucleoside-diphosphate-sugar epimerase
MKIVITGASGFIGQLLKKKHLDLGDQVHILSRKERSEFEYDPNLFYHKGDLLDFRTLDTFLIDTDVLYHCAAEIRDESKMQAVNIEGTENLLKASSGKIKHWVQLSSVGVYGPVYSGYVSEDYSYNPINQYEKTKLQSDLLVINSAKQNRFTYTLIRPSNVFGSEMRNASLFQLIKMINSGYYFFIGPKGASANYVPVSNVVQALFLAATHPRAKNEIYNISSWMTMESFIAIIAKELGKPMPKIRIPLFFINLIARLLSVIPKNPLTISRVKALTNRSIYLNTKIEDQLGYKALESNEIALAELVRFYKK